MKHALSRAMSIQPEQISIKGTTLEQMGFTGRKEGIAALAVVLLKKLL
jgi:2-C-methyl-D-erythritol 2,4-cyclodiphosphate synthase